MKSIYSSYLFFIQEMRFLGSRLEGKSEKGFGFANAGYGAEFVDDFSFEGFKGLFFDDGG
jgi:hypothetical protein